jgi:hypothetical protein
MNGLNMKEPYCTLCGFWMSCRKSIHVQHESSWCQHGYSMGCHIKPWTHKIDLFWPNCEQCLTVLCLNLLANKHTRVYAGWHLVT